MKDESRNQIEFATIFGIAAPLLASRYGLWAMTAAMPLGVVAGVWLGIKLNRWVDRNDSYIEAMRKLDEKMVKGPKSKEDVESTLRDWDVRQAQRWRD